MPRPFIVAIAALIGLTATGAASAHVVATPAFLPSGSSESIRLAGPNERDAPMTAFSVTAPPGLEIEHAHEVAGWSAQLDGSTATWTGGSLAPNAQIDFGVTLRADVDPGFADLEARQRYADGGVVRWPVRITITPASESPSQSLALGGVVALIGVLAIVAIAMLAWRRRGPS